MLIGSIDGLVPAPALGHERVAATKNAPPVGHSPAETPSKHDISQVVKQANEAIRTISQAVEFSYDPDSNVTVVQVVDTQNHKVLRQVPSREMIEIAQALERMQTMLVRSKA
ncbi:MAG: flagellar protein FlaG [Casimicrobiaceae bacterium]